MKCFSFLEKRTRKINLTKTKKGIVSQRILKNYVQYCKCTTYSYRNMVMIFLTVVFSSRFCVCNNLSQKNRNFFYFSIFFVNKYGAVPFVHYVRTYWKTIIFLRVCSGARVSTNEVTYEKMKEYRTNILHNTILCSHVRMYM